MKYGTLSALLFCFSYYGYSQANWYSLSAFEFFRLAEVHEVVNIYEPDYSLIEAAIFHATNISRAEYDLPSLKVSKELISAAQKHSQSMKKLNYFGHINPRTKALKTPEDRVNRQGLKFKYLAENIAECGLYHLMGEKKAYQNGSGKITDKAGVALPLKSYGELAQTIVIKWMNSPKHRKNILGNYVFLGCGVSSIIMNSTQRDLPYILITQKFTSP